MTEHPPRVMVERLFSIPKVHAELQKMMDAIDQDLHVSVPGSGERSGDQEEDILRPVVCVLVTCLSGTHVSPCFVERLYEQYHRRRSSAREGLIVWREHTHPLFKAPQLAGGKEYIWQRSVLPMRYLHDEDLTRRRMWSPLPPHLLNIVEEGFRTNPLDTQLEVPYSSKTGASSKYVISFETGEMYSAHEKKRYRIRCAVFDVNALIGCSMLSDATYRPLGKKYNSAGVLFYSPHPETGGTVFLLGQMTYGYLSWCDFGGIKNFRQVGLIQDLRGDNSVPNLHGLTHCLTTSSTWWSE